MKILCKNEYTIRKVHADGHETTEARFHNVPLTAFYRAVIGHINYNTEGMVHSCWFGKGSAEPSSSDTGLSSNLWTYGWNYSNIISWKKYLNEDNHICYKYTFKVTADQDHVGTATEVGIAICSANPGLALATHALILDAEGNPMSITKTDLEVLYVDVVFEFSLQDNEHFKWFPENYYNYGSKSGTGWAPIFSLRLFDRIFFLGKMHENGFSVRHAMISFTKGYSSDYHEMYVSGGRLPQTTVTSQRYVKGIAIGSSSNNMVLGVWELPDPDIIPEKVLSGMQVGVGDGEMKTFNAPIAEWVKNTEEIYVNDVKLTRGTDYTCGNENNAQGLIECSVLQDMEYIGETMTAAQNIITPIVGHGSAMSGQYVTAKWNAANPTLKYAFPEDAVKPIRRFLLKNFIAYYSLSSGGASYNTNWSGAYWTIRYSNDNEEWNDAGTVTITDNAAELILENKITARYWSFTISSRITGNWFAGQSIDSIMAWGDDKPIVFAEAPAADAVITMNATVACPMKNENFIIDVNPTFSV